ncbi:MAG: nucleotidyl transferase AbiEii/AbiGii toxin family protein [Endomicrobiales bacterium]|nr:nucleotidyl transferase AbiEii/AbiGii toxin family protein [Endomicrobiales bacterium]
MTLNSLQSVEIFHIEFLRAFSKKFKPDSYALKGGVNMRLFFKSVRYSEDMDLDVITGGTVTLRETVMKILSSPSFLGALKSYGIREIRPPDLSKAKQTETTQRFKVHLLSASGEDIPTKIEFSRRCPAGSARPVVGQVSDEVLRTYKALPLMVSHYGADDAVAQKIGALSDRKVTQARDIFDLYVLSTQYSGAATGGETAKRARDNLLGVEFGQFRDTVLSYLSEEDRSVYNSPSAWDDIKLKVSAMICPERP